MSPLHASARLVFLLSAAAITTLMGCASTPERPAADKRAADQKYVAQAPAPAIQPIAGFSPALRCMDTLLLDYGARDITVTIDDLADKSNGSGAGAKDMLVSAVSDMTQRSRAIRIVAAGKVAPQYTVRGSLNLLDNQSVQRNGANLAAAVLGIDLTLLTAQDMSVVPGIAARDSVVLFKQGKSYDGKAEISKFGVTFGLSTTNGVGQASRALVELASVELFGRLARVPYWTCLGMTEAHPGVSAEVQDWYDSMAAQPSEFVRYFQTQLRARRVYEGPIDGATNPVNAQLKDAVARYREALGLSREPKLSLDFFKAYLAADHHQIEAKMAQAAPAPAQPTPVAAPPPPPATPIGPKAPAADSVMVVSAPAAPKGSLALRVGTVNDAQRFGRGEPVQLVIRPSRDAYVYCFLQDENKKIIRFFPNRFQRDSRVQTAEGLRLPGDMRFEITMNPRGVQETISCFATDRDVLAQLPAGVNAGDFDPLPVNSLEQVRTAFVKVANGGLAHDTFQIQPK